MHSTDCNTQCSHWTIVRGILKGTIVILLAHKAITVFKTNYLL